jgi:hypothetical protein
LPAIFYNHNFTRHANGAAKFSKKNENYKRSWEYLDSNLQFIKTTDFETIVLKQTIA